MKTYSSLFDFLEGWLPFVSASGGADTHQPPAANGGVVRHLTKMSHCLTRDCQPTFAYKSKWGY